MVCTNRKPMLTVGLSFWLLASIPFASAQIYKTVDGNGNISFTDRAPDESAEQVKVSPISVISAPAYEAKTKPSATDKPENRDLTIDNKTTYADFSLTSPKEGQAVWDPELIVDVVWASQYKLREGMKVNIFLDEVLFRTTTIRKTPLGPMPRGTHTVSVELVDANNNQVTAIGPVTFNIYQPKNYPKR